MTQPVAILGGGGMGRCVLDVIDAVNLEHLTTGSPMFEVVGVYDDGQPDGDLLSARGVKFLGPIERLHDQPHDVGFLIGIASTAAKQSLDAAFRDERPSPVVVHPNVHQGFGVELGPGSVVCSHVSMENNISLGRHVHVNQNSTVGHDAALCDYVTISPLVAVSGNVTMEPGVFVGTGASIHQGLALGPGATVGMGAAVIRDVEAGTTVVGVPASVR